MDWIAIRQNAGKYLGKYKFALLILAVGLFLMSFPYVKEAPDTVAISAVMEEETLEQRLSTILSQIQGVGKAQVLLTEAYGTESVYQTDGTSGTDGRTETVIITDDSRKEAGLIRQVISPIYRGAIVVCQGGENASVRLAVMEAVANVTGIPTSRITVLKMN